jgi:hypothetical protein
MGNRPIPHSRNSLTATIAKPQTAVAIKPNPVKDQNNQNPKLVGTNITPGENKTIPSLKSDTNNNTPIQNTRNQGLKPIIDTQGNWSTGKGADLRTGNGATVTIPPGSSVDPKTGEIKVGNNSSFQLNPDRKVVDSKGQPVLDPETKQPLIKKGDSLNLPPNSKIQTNQDGTVQSIKIPSADGEGEYVYDPSNQTVKDPEGKTVPFGSWAIDSKGLVDIPKFNAEREKLKEQNPNAKLPSFTPSHGAYSFGDKGEADNYFKDYLQSNPDLNGLGKLNETGEFVPTNGNKMAAIFAAAVNSKGMSSKEAAGTNNGRLACAWAVSKVLNKAGIMGDTILGCDALEAKLKGIGAKEVSIDQAPAGAIVFVGGGGGSGAHVGVRVGEGKDLSNSSSRGSFSLINNFKNDKRGRARAYVLS